MVSARIGGLESGGITVKKLLKDLEYLRCSCHVPVKTIAYLVGVSEGTYKTWVYGSKPTRIPGARQEPPLREAVDMLQFLFDTKRLPRREGYVLLFGVRETKRLATERMVKEWMKLWPVVKDDLDAYVSKP